MQNILYESTECLHFSKSYRCSGDDLYCEIFGFRLHHWEKLEINLFLLVSFLNINHRQYRQYNSFIDGEYRIEFIQILVKH